MPYYRINYLPKPNSSKQYNYKIFQGMSIPFTYNNIVWDENNLPWLWNRSTKSDQIRASGNTSSYLAYIYNGFYTNGRYAYNIFYSTLDIQSEYLVKLKTVKISGKFKPNTQGKFYNDSIAGVYLLKGQYIKPSTGISNNFKYFMLTGVSSSSGNVFPKINNSSNTSSQSYKYALFSNPANIANQDFKEPSGILYFDVRNNITDLILDFGTSQEVPEDFYNWFIQNFDRVYENTYTIKSTTGETLTTLTEAPPMISATLSAVGNAKYLTLKGENNTNYKMEWTSETPQGKIFAGLATSKGGSIAIPVGETVTINLTDSTDLYEVWQTYRPPTTTFDINLYKNSAEPNKVDKTAELSTVDTISGVLRQECSLINPEIIIQYDKPPDFNYCYIANFGRYYYVENIVSMRQNLWRVRLRCDVLMTYKTQILNLNARIARQQYTYSYRQIDSEIPFTNDPEITIQDIPNNLNLGKPNNENILLTVVDNGT